MSKCELPLNRLLHCDKSWRAFGNTKESIKHEPQCSQMSGVFCHSNFVIWHSMRTSLLVLWLRIFYLSPISNNFSWNPHHSYFMWYHFRSMDHFAGQLGDHLRACTDIQLTSNFPALLSEVQITCCLEFWLVHRTFKQSLVLHLRHFHFSASRC